MQVLHQYNSVRDCILWFIFFSKILFSLLFAVLSSNDVSPRTPWPQEGPLMSPLSTVGGLWGVLSGVCQNSPLCLKTDPTRVLFQAASTLLTNADLKKMLFQKQLWFSPKKWIDMGLVSFGEGRRSSGIPRCASADFITQGFTGNHALLSDQEESMVLSWWCLMVMMLSMMGTNNEDFITHRFLGNHAPGHWWWCSYAMHIENTCRDLIWFHMFDYSKLWVFICLLKWIAWIDA